MPEIACPKARIRALLTDVDGVWTDGGMYFDQRGQALKRFDVKDGYIVALVRESGVRVVWVTGDDSDITRARARRLGIDQVCSGVEDKGACVQAVLTEHGLCPDEIVYMGDDLNDLPAISAAGFSACPADAVPQVQEAVSLVLSRKGGHGAVREICELIMKWNQRFQGARAE